MISAQLLLKVDSRLKQITGNFQSHFGGLDIILIGDLRQLPPVRSTPIYKQPKQTIVGPILWRNLKCYELNEVMRQANQQFSSIFTKIGNGEQLDKRKITLIDSRFCTGGEAEARYPQGIRLFNTNNSFNEHNNKILNAYVDRITSTAKDVYICCTSKKTRNFRASKITKMSLIDTNGLPYQAVYVENIYYMITTNIDVTDGLPNSAVGKLVHVETNYEGLVKTIWFVFPDLPQIGKKLRRKVAGNAAEINVSRMAVPIVLRSSNIPLNNNKTIFVKRTHVPLVCACAATIHKSQETWLDYESDIFIPNFNCIEKYKRPNTRAGGVEIYQNSSDVVINITPSMDCSVSQSDMYGTIQSSEGDLCSVECDEVEKLAYQLNEEAERTERPIRRLSKVMYGSTCADMQVDVMVECLSSIKHVVGTGRPTSRFIVARRLHGGGLFARRPVRCVPLTPAHRRRRSLWCREHRNWRDNEWGRVLFTDESRFSLSSDSHRILLWRERGSCNHPSNIIERDRYGGRGVLVWGGIMLGSRTDLHIFDAGSVNGTRYCNEILLPYVRLFRGAMGLQFLFMDDNAPCHRTVAAEQLLESEDIERMDRPARSPDLNPIEHVWDFLGRRLAARTLPPVTIREFRLALQDEWAAMRQQLSDTLILSMGRRCETCLAVRRDPIPY
ncbi:transposable element Tcb2 transposase [Trichonephila clavipes]|nr:transposable element Tcb2 transposase [Trichonephila clavipes]